MRVCAFPHLGDFLWLLLVAILFHLIEDTNAWVREQHQPPHASSLGQRRTFQFVQNDRQPFENPQGRCSISCDGRIPGVSLELSHWNGNSTPRRFYADTSTEIALQLPTDEYTDAVVVNNHFDTDGVLSVFACLQPEMARDYRQLLIDAAEAGDFGEWSSERGLQLDATIEGIATEMGGGHAHGKEIYDRVLPELPNILRDIEENQGRDYAPYWTPRLARMHESYESIRSGHARIAAADNCPHLIITQEPSSWLARPAIHRALVEQNLWKDSYRILRTRTTAPASHTTPATRSSLSTHNDIQQYTTRDNSSQHSISSIRYEKPGHWWVSRLRDRHVIPSAQCNRRPKRSNHNPLADDYDDNDEEEEEDLSLSLSRQTRLQWKNGGESLSCLCHVDTVPSNVHADALVATIVDALQDIEERVLRRPA